MNENSNHFGSFTNKPGANEHVKWINDLGRQRLAGPSFNCNRQIDPSLGASTVCVHAGTYEDYNTGAVGTPVFATTTFRFSEATYESFLEGFIRDIPTYTRYGNPNQWSVQLKLAALEGAQSALVFGSGMAAITTTLIALSNKDGHIISSRDLYGGSYALLRADMHQYGRSVSYVDPLDLDAIRAEIKDNTQIIFLEVMTNPLMKAVDLKVVAEICEEHDILLIVDNTFLSPISSKPLAHGADVVIHSGTKYLNGHSDLTCGTAAGSRKLIDRIWAQLLRFGGILDAQSCHLLERSLKTLAIRMKAHRESAMAITDFLSRHPKVNATYSPYLPGENQARLMTYCDTLSTGMLSFEVAGGDDAALRLLRSLDLITAATSLGGVETLISLPFNTSHSGLTVAQQVEIGIAPGLVRLSVGIESPDDLCRELDQALATL
jgi:cystathionine beta-lyase/cystathionine gamma-synthase